MALDLSSALEGSLQPSAAAPAFFNYIRTYVDLQLSAGLAGLDLSGGGGGARMARKVLTNAQSGDVVYHGLNTEGFFGTCRLSGEYPDPLAYLTPIIVNGVVDRMNVRFNYAGSDGWTGAVEIVAVTITTQPLGN